MTGEFCDDGRLPEIKNGEADDLAVD